MLSIASWIIGCMPPNVSDILVLLRQIPVAAATRFTIIHLREGCGGSDDQSWRPVRITIRIIDMLPYGRSNF